MQAVGLEPTRANTLRPERSTLDHSVTLAANLGIWITYIYNLLEHIIYRSYAQFC